MSPTITRSRQRDVVASTDRALAALPPRDLVTFGEAQDILEGVRASTSETIDGPAISAVVDDALASVRDQETLDRSRVVDALLDIRNAVTRCEQ